METCEFSYIGIKTHLLITATGIEKSWDSLKEEFNISGPGIPGATYYKTISVQGPQLFAVLVGTRVFYHDNGRWHPYNTASDIKFGLMNMTSEGIERATETNSIETVKEQLSQEEQSDLPNIQE